MQSPVANAIPFTHSIVISCASLLRQLLRHGGEIRHGRTFVKHHMKLQPQGLAFLHGQLAIRMPRSLSERIGDEDTIITIVPPAGMSILRGWENRDADYRRTDLPRVITPLGLLAPCLSSAFKTIAAGNLTTGFFSK